MLSMLSTARLLEAHVLDLRRILYIVFCFLLRSDFRLAVAKQNERCCCQLKLLLQDKQLKNKNGDSTHSSGDQTDVRLDDDGGVAASVALLASSHQKSIGLGRVSFLRTRSRVSGLLIWQLPKKRVQALGAGLQKHLKRWVESSPDPVPALEALEECREYIQVHSFLKKLS